jgi:hypothetical protein
MKRFAVGEYVFDPIKGEYTNYEGQIKAFVEAEDEFEACEKAGMDDPTKYYASHVYPQQLKKFQEDIKKEKELLGKLEGNIEAWINEEVEKSKLCPNCEKKLNEKGECKECGYGRDEIAIDGNIITKKMWEAHEKAMKKAANKAKKVAKAKPTVK